MLCTMHDVVVERWTVLWLSKGYKQQNEMN